MKNKIKCNLIIMSTSMENNSIMGKTYRRIFEAIYYPNNNIVLVEPSSLSNSNELIFRSFITFIFNKKEFTLNFIVNDKYAQSFNITKDEEYSKFNSEFNSKKLDKELKTKVEVKTKKIKI